MALVDVVDIVVPRRFLVKCSSHYLFGCYKTFEKHLIVCCLFACNEDLEFLCLSASNKLEDVGSRYCKIGYFLNHDGKKNTFIVPKFNSEDISFVLVIAPTTWEVAVERFLYQGYSITSNNVRLIFCDPEDFVHCQLIKNLRKNYFIEFLSHSMQNSLIAVNDCYETAETVFPVHNIPKENTVLEAMISILLILISIASKLLDKVIKCWPKWVANIYCKTFVGRQFQQRLIYLQYLKEECKTKNKFSLRCSNIMYGILFDLFIGLVAVKIFHNHFSSHFLLSTVMSTTNEMVNLLQRLIHWLMGVPAGLKLNIPLNSILGHFFLYHIYLWKSYIDIIQPVFDVLLKILMSIGVLGFTFVLCLVHDIISLATVHIYCFYGYAARLYYYQLYCIIYLWRVFRGKKWNPELRRVETYTYDVHILYVGTLVFTVLLFLLPTVMVYYFVFAMLRIAVLTFQGIISKVVHILTVFPIYVIVLRFFNSTLTAGDIAFTVMKQQDNTCVLSLQAVQVPLSSLIRETLPSTIRHEEYMSWKSFFSSLVRGKIIYPL